jgi:uncharacterized protein YoxC
VLAALNQASGIIAALALVTAVVAVLLLRGLQRRVDGFSPDLRVLSRGMKGKELPEALQEVFGYVQDMGRRLQQVEDSTGALQAEFGRAIQKVGLVRFNSDDGIHGALSFALALLDSESTGVILSSLYTLEMCRIFIRAVDAGKTQHGLMPEEHQALEMALRSGSGSN